MRRIALLPALLLASSIFVLGQANQGPTPPGPDAVGADRTTHRPGSVSRADPQQNQRMTNNTGTSWGDEHRTPSAGESVYSTSTAQGNNGVKGQQGQEAAISGRQRAHNRTYSSKDTSVEPMNNSNRRSGMRSENGTDRMQAGNTSRRSSRRTHHRRKRNTTQQASEPRQ